jgi:hypothetical protein
MSGPMIAVWFSCGAASAWAAKLTIERFGYTHDIRLVNNPVAEEDPDNQRFARDVADWLGAKIETASNPKFPDHSAVSVWDHEKYMSGVAGAPCTKILKKHARQAWELENKPDLHVLGFTAEEKDRHERFIMTERSNVVPALIDARASKADCFAEIRKVGIDLPGVYKRGYPNANCIGCVKATSATYWNHVREKDPEVFDARAEQSRRLGCRLVRVKGERKFLDELKTTDTGRPLKNMDFECGIFCEERAA